MTQSTLSVDRRLRLVVGYGAVRRCTPLYYAVQSSTTQYSVFQALLDFEGEMSASTTHFDHLPEYISPSRANGAIHQ